MLGIDKNGEYVGKLAENNIIVKHYLVGTAGDSIICSKKYKSIIGNCYY